MKLAVVVQRYGADINGGAELHARYIAERLARHVEVEVLTTCASDYVTWGNTLPAGEERVNGLIVRRFPVSHPRDTRVFGHRSAHVFDRQHSFRDELRWLDSEGPASPGLVRYISTHAQSYEYFLFFSYRYYHAWHGARAVPGRAVLVPTAERDPAIGLDIFSSIFRGVRAIMYNSHEERAMIQAVAHNHDVPGVVVGIGSDVPERTDPARFRQKFGIDAPYVIYVGRIDENKGCRQLFDYFQTYARAVRGHLQLVLVGNSILPIPDHPRVRHLGFLPDQDKFDAMAGAEALIMPSYYESLSMVALEAWALGRPVLANGGCDVLRGQSIRSNAGLYYETLDEFVQTLYALERDRGLNRALGVNGRTFFRRHYAWPVIENKYLDMLARLEEDRAPQSRMEPLPGWWSRQRRSLPAARHVLASVPAGPVIGRDSEPAPAARASRGRQSMAARTAVPS